MTQAEEPLFTVSSGNPFKDFGMPDADARLAKAQLAQKITAVMREQGLTQEELARRLGVDQPRVSKLTRGQLEIFSIERLMELVTRLNVDVVITPIDTHGARPGRLIVRDPADDHGAGPAPRQEDVRLEDPSDDDSDDEQALVAAGSSGDRAATRFD